LSRLENNYNDNDTKIYLNLKKNDSLDFNSNFPITYKIKSKKEEVKAKSTTIKIDNETLSDNNKSSFNIQTHKKSQMDLENNLKKRSSLSLDNVYFEKKNENKEQTEPVMSLQELLKHWGIDISDEKPTVRSQRGDIEIKELISSKSHDSSARGDVPAPIFYSDSVVNLDRTKRDIINKEQQLLWSNKTPKTEIWGFSENDGLFPNEKISYESNEPERNYRPDDIKKNRHHGNLYNPNSNYVYDFSNTRLMREKQKSEEEKRLQWEEYEQKRDEELRRRIDENQRRKDEEQRRKDDEQRKKDEEQRKIMEERQRITEKQQNHENEQRRINEEYERNVRVHNRINKERQRNFNEQRSNDDKQQSNGIEQDRNSEVDRRDENKQPITNENDIHDIRVKQWHLMKYEHDKLLNAKNQNRNQVLIRKNLEEIENEKKLQDYIRRNTPIVIGNRKSHNPFQSSASVTLPEQKKIEYSPNRFNERRPANVQENRFEEYRWRIDEERRHHSPERNQYKEQIPRKQEKYGRRQEEDRIREYQNEIERNHNDDKNIRYGNQNNNQPSNEEERVRNNEDVRIFEQRKRLMEEQNKRYEEQRKQHNQEFQRINGNPRDKNLVANQHYISHNSQYSHELDRTINNEQNISMEKDRAKGKARQPHRHEMQNHQNHDFQQHIPLNESIKKNNENIKGKYLPQDNRFHQSDANVRENLEYLSSINDAEDRMRRPQWTERLETMTPVMIEDKRIGIEQEMEKEVKPKQNGASDVIAETNNSHLQLRERPDQRSNVETKGWRLSKQDIQKQNNRLQLKEQKREKDDTKEK
jgi:hypothetical protein